MIPSASQFLIKKGSSGVLVQSRGSCILLLVSYGFWLFYQLHTHSKFYNEESRKIPVDIVPKGDKRGGDNEDSEAPSPQLTLSVIALVLGIFVTLLTFNTRFTADSIDSLLDDAGLMPSFIGLIIMPMLNNDPTILVAAAKNKMDLSIAFMLGKVYSNCSGRGPNHHSSCMGYESWGDEFSFQWLWDCHFVRDCACCEQCCDEREEWLVIRSFVASSKYNSCDCFIYVLRYGYSEGTGCCGNESTKGSMLLLILWL